MGAAFNLVPHSPSSEETRILKDLHVARTALIKDRTRLHNRAQTQGIAVLKRQTKARLTQAERQIAELDAEIAALIARHEATAGLCCTKRPEVEFPLALDRVIPRVEFAVFQVR